MMNLCSAVEAMLSMLRAQYNGSLRQCRLLCQFWLLHEALMVSCQFSKLIKKHHVVCHKSVMIDDGVIYLCQSISDSIICSMSVSSFSLGLESFLMMYVENPNTRLILISCSQGILCSSSLSCYLLLRLLVYMYLSQLMRTFTDYLKCIVISP